MPPVPTTRNRTAWLPKPFLIISLLLLMALLLVPLGAADPLFRSSDNVRPQSQRDSSFHLKFRAPADSPRPDTIYRTETAPLRMQAQPAAAPTAYTTLDPFDAPAPALHANPAQPAAVTESARQPAWQAITAEPTDSLDSAATATTDRWPAVAPNALSDQIQAEPQPLPSIRPPAQQLAPPAPMEPTLTVPNAAIPDPLQDSSLPLLAPAQQPLISFQQPVDEEPAEAQPAPVVERNPILECRSETCEATARRLKPTALHSISLDVTPSYNPNLSEPPPRLQPEVREWRDSDGAVVASGQLADFRFGRITIQDAEGHLQKFPIEQMSDVDRCYVSDVWGFPLKCRLAGSDGSSQRDFTAISLSWTASAICQQPLFFEDVTLERYGYTAGPFLQPFRSGAHFFTNIAIMPYRAGIHPINECIYTLGYFRPGTPAPEIRPAFPLSIRGGLWQAGVVTGGAVLLP
jgi:hypothetical protein